MALKDTKQNILVNGITHSVFYDKDTGAVEVRTEVQTGQGPATGGDAVYNSNTGAIEGFNQSQIESTVSANDNVVKALSTGKKPGFLSSDTINLATDPIAKKVKESFSTTAKDTYFGSSKAAQYPADALYGKKNSQDHLVISQYRYKPPRAKDIWGPDKSSVSDLLTKGLARSSPLDEFLGLVRMPMPNAIQDSNNVAWGEDTVNALEAAALSAAGGPLSDDITAGGIGALIGLAAGGNPLETAQSGVAINLVKKALTDGSLKADDLNSSILRPELQSRILATLGIETSAEAILARKEGVVPNSNLELLFSGPTLRQFSFVYKMSPRSKPEASIVNQILRFFKQGMSARKQNAKGGGELAGGRSYFLGTPNVFRLQYRTDENEAIKGLNRIKTCALTGTSVNYTPEGAFASYEKGQPVSVLLTLAFQELEPIYDSDYKYEGGDGERKDDTGEGYRWAIDEKEVGY